MLENLKGREFARFRADAFQPHKLEIKIRLRRPSVFQYGYDEHTDQVMIEVLEALAQRIAAAPDAFLEGAGAMSAPKIVN